MHDNWSHDPQREAEPSGNQNPPPPPTQWQAQTQQYSPQPEEQPRSRKFGWPVLLVSILLAALIGGGIGGLAVNAVTSDSSGTTVEHSPQLNRTDEVTPTTEAASVASPSVVTLSVGGEQAQGSGSGVILDEQGHILTNTHVVTLGGQTAAADVLVQTNDGGVHEAEVVGLDPLSDLAVIQIEAENLDPIEMGTTEELNVGDQAIAIGAPLGLSGTVTEGIISTLDRTRSEERRVGKECQHVAASDHQKIERNKHTPRFPA